jgi:hypothetical protein
MRILVIGSLGSQGRRYCAILKYLGIDFVKCDIYNKKEIQEHPPKVDHAIITTPVLQHYEWCLWCIATKIDFLCEKPVSKSITQVKTIKDLCEKNNVDGRMVCNWAFTCRYQLFPNKNIIKFNYYNTGKDGKYDLSQPLYLSKNFKIKTTSPIYECEINGQKISQIDFDKSYVAMILNWITFPEKLWSMDDAIKSLKKVISCKTF